MDCTHVGSFYRLKKGEIAVVGNLCVGAHRITLFRFNLGLMLVDSLTRGALSGEEVERDGSRIPSAN